MECWWSENLHSLRRWYGYFFWTKFLIAFFSLQRLNFFSSRWYGNTRESCFEIIYSKFSRILLFWKGQKHWIRLPSVICNGSFTLPNTETDTDKMCTEPMKICIGLVLPLLSIIMKPNSIGVGISLGLGLGVDQWKHTINGTKNGDIDGMCKRSLKQEPLKL